MRAQYPGIPQPVGPTKPAEGLVELPPVSVNTGNSVGTVLRVVFFQVGQRCISFFPAAQRIVRKHATTPSETDFLIGFAVHLRQRRRRVALPEQDLRREQMLIAAYRIEIEPSVICFQCFGVLSCIEITRVIRKYNCWNYRIVTRSCSTVFAVEVF